MDVDKQRVKDVLIVTLAGRIDNDGADALERLLRDAVRGQTRRFIVDMHRVQSLNSSALRVLANTLTHVRNEGGDLLIAALNGRVERIFQIIGFDQHFTLFPSKAEALIHFYPAQATALPPPQTSISAD